LLRLTLSAMSIGKLGARALRNKYDYVIVGAGSAGCVMAHRLVKEHGASVLLLEAGKSNRGDWDSWKNLMPAALTFNLADTKYNWDYHTVPQKGLDMRELHEPRGKILGGSSSLNAMAYVRGHALDYERWAEEIGSEQWSYKHTLPYFKKAQWHDYNASKYRGGDGPLCVGRQRTEIVKPINDAFVEAGQQAGYPFTDDANGFQQEGFGAMDMTVNTDTGLRASTADMYLHPLLKDRAAGLDVATHSTALRVLFDGKRAIGVECEDTKGGVHQLFADQEVVLSAGAVGTPQLLMVSGIGNKKDLSEHGIDVFHELPNVGYNLQDHLEFYIQYKAHHTSLYPYAATFGGFGLLSKYLFRYPWLAGFAGAQWFLKGSGMSATNHFEVGGFIRSAANIPHPDVQYHFIPGCVVGQLDFLPEHGYQAHCGTLRPTSRGTIKLASKDPRQAPLIDPAFLTTEQDVIDQRNAFRLTVEIMEQEALKAFHKTPLNPPAGFNIDDDAAVDAWIRANSHSGYHLSCTCAMGSVVDENGLVYDLNGLRIADASVMPSMTSGNLNAPTIMLAEKIADAVRGVQLPSQEDATWYTPDEWQIKQR